MIELVLEALDVVGVVGGQPLDAAFIDADLVAFFEAADPEAGPTA